LLWCEEKSLLDTVKISFYNFYSFEKTDAGTFLDSSTGGGKINLLFTDFNFASSGEKKNYGFSVKTDNVLKNFPCTIKYGNLSASGSYSKLNNPLISAPSSPFSASSTTANCVTASLPGASSFSKPETLFSQFCFVNKKTPLQTFKINCFYNPQADEAVYSSLIQIKLPLNIKIGVSATAGNFLYKENTFSSWFTTEDFYYHQGKHNCANLSFSINTKKIESAFSSSFYESPFGKYEIIFKSENKLKTKHSVFNLSGLFNQNKLITSSQKNISDCFQIKTGLIYNSRCETTFPLFIKTGVTFYGNFNLSDTEHNVRLSAGIQLTSNLSILTFTALINARLYTDFYLQECFDSASLQLTNSWYFQKVTTTLKTSFSINPTEDFSSITYINKYSADFRFNKLILFANSLNLTFKDYQLKKMSQNSTFQLEIHKNRINYTYKLNLEWQLDG